MTASISKATLFIIALVPVVSLCSAPARACDVIGFNAALDEPICQSSSDESGFTDASHHFGRFQQIIRAREIEDIRSHVIRREARTRR
jgi:hypothetical protein